jgi:hypothetical protein
VEIPNLWPMPQEKGQGKEIRQTHDANLIPGDRSSAVMNSRSARDAEPLAAPVKDTT